MMGVAPDWASGSAAAPDWWLDTWARRLASEWLAPPLRDDVTRWLEQVQGLLHDRPSGLGTIESWLADANGAVESGVDLEARVLAEVGSRGV